MEDWMVKLSKVLNELAQKNNIVLTEPIVILPLVDKDPLSDYKKTEYSSK
jgi:hypothetical protein